MERDRWDVAVLGGGPAGCAAALTLRARAPSLSVLLIEASSYAEPRLGEMLPGAARSLLDQLDVRDAFEAQQFMPAFASAAAWSSPQLMEDHFLFSARSHGWHLERARFDAMLANEARRRRAFISCDTTAVESARHAGAWHLTLSNRRGVSARFIVDATGRRAAFARSRGAVFHKLDSLMGFVRFAPCVAGSDPRTLVEAFPDGFWYTARVREDVRVVACMSDISIARKLELSDAARWWGLLNETRWIKRTVPDDVVRAMDQGAQPPARSLFVRPCDSKLLSCMTGDGWLATGDAAMAVDPLSSQGITRALRSGILAAYAAEDGLTGGGGNGWRLRYEAIHRREFLGYLRAYQSIYGAVGRFGDREFWRKRSARPEDRSPAPPAWLR